MTLPFIDVRHPLLTMEEDCPVDAGNVSLSDEEYERQIFITQSDCCNISTQKACEAADFFSDLCDVNFSDESKIEKKDLLNSDM